MRKIIDSALKSISEFFKKLSKAQKIRLAILAIAIIVLAVVVAVVLGRTTYAVLYSGLDSAQAGEIIAALDEMQVDYKTEGSGTILVPEESVSQVKMQIAAQGFLADGFDYSLYANAGGFGTTENQNQAYYNFMLENNLAQQILMIDKVNKCLVKLYLPTGSSFVLNSNTEQASAAVTLALATGATLTETEVEAIASIVSSGASVPIENIDIVDTNARFYRVGDESATGSGKWADQIALENQVRLQLESQVENLLATVFGGGRVKASVYVTLNFDKETQQSTVFEPPVEGSEEGLVVSMEELYEYTRDATAGGVVGTDTNGIGTVEYPYDFGEDTDYYYIARTFNYEINETVTQLEKAQATVKDLSVSVVLDSVYIETDYTETVRDLVMNAIGVNENHVTVAQLPFEETSAIDPDIEALQKIMDDLQTADTVKFIIQWVVIVLLALAVLLFLRELLKTVFRKEDQELAMAGAPLDALGENIDYTAGEGEEDFSLEDLDLSSKSEIMGQLEKFIDKDSKAIAQMLRNWLSDDE